MVWKRRTYFVVEPKSKDGAADFEIQTSSLTKKNNQKI